MIEPCIKLPSFLRWSAVRIFAIWTSELVAQGDLVCDGDFSGDHVRFTVYCDAGQARSRRQPFRRAPGNRPGKSRGRGPARGPSHARPGRMGTPATLARRWKSRGWRRNTRDHEYPKAHGDLALQPRQRLPNSRRTPTFPVPPESVRRSAGVQGVMLAWTVPQTGRRRLAVAVHLPRVWVLLEIVLDNVF